MGNVLPFMLTLVVSILASYVGCTATERKHTDTESLSTEIEKELTEDTVTTISSEQDTKDKMLSEVVELWELYLDDNETKIQDPRREKLDEYANYVVNVVRDYQVNGVENHGKITKLPEHENVHLLVATMMTVESALYPEVVGSLGEVGMLQVHGAALNGYKPEVVRNDPELGIRLGVRWLTVNMDECKLPKYEEWSDEDWAGPLSIYAAGTRAKKDGKCMTFKAARKRIRLTKNYRSRMLSLDEA